MEVVSDVMGLLARGEGGAAGMLFRMARVALSDLLFFREISGFLTHEIGVFQSNLFERVVNILGVGVVSLLTIWIVIQGYRIVTGQSRESMMVLVTNSLRATLIVGLALGAAKMSGSTFHALTDGLSNTVTATVSGTDEDVYERVDRCLAYMQLALSSIDVVDVGGDEILNDKKDRALWFAGLGTGGPAVMAGTMLLLNKIAMALFVGLGPLFVLCLLFDQTKSLFGRWLYYGLGTMFSLGVLSVMVTLATDMVIAVAKAFWASSLLGAGPENVSSMAMQQGGLGLVMTMLIISAPPMAAMFFQGTMGQFYGNNAFATQSGSAVPAGHPAYVPYAAPGSTTVGSPSPSQAAVRHEPVLGRVEGYSPQADVIKR